MPNKINLKLKCSQMLRFKPFLVISFSLMFNACQSADLYQFERIIIDGEIADGNGLSLADIDGDGLIDIIKSADASSQFAWYQNPQWTRHLVTSESYYGLASAPYDIDGDGDIDLVRESFVDQENPAAGGFLQWLENPGNPSEVQQWPVHTIAQISAPQRVRWVDVLGNAKKVLVSLPIITADKQWPDVGNDSRELLAYPIPRNPKGKWQSVLLSKQFAQAYAFSVADLNADKDALLIASATGVDLLQFASEEQFVLQSHLGDGRVAAASMQGSGEVALGRIAGQQFFVASIEPRLGNELVVYTGNSTNELPWERTVIDSNLMQGNALQVADINNDGNDEIVVGSHANPFAIYTYRINPDDGLWYRETLGHSRTSVAAIEIADINGDGRDDIVAIGLDNTDIILFQSEQ